MENFSSLCVDIARLMHNIFYDSISTKGVKQYLNIEDIVIGNT